MGLASALISLNDGILPESFEGLKTKLDIGWIEAALSAHEAASIRNRKLSAEQVVWLIVGMALYRNRPIAEIVRRLDLVLPDSNGEPQTVSPAAIPPARDRVGWEPLCELFQITARHWAMASAERHRWRGLLVLGADGTQMRVPDTRENRETFELPGSRVGSPGYPQIQVVALMALRSHLLLDFRFAGCRTGESTLAAPMLERVPSRSLIILDRHYRNYRLLMRIQSGQERHWLVRAYDNVRLRTVKTFGPSDELVELRLSPQSRKLHPELPETFVVRAVRYQRTGFRPRTLLTSLLDPEKYPAAELVELYHERWELEIGYDEIKTHTLENLESIRSKTPERIAQEVWGLAIAYNIVRHEMELVADRCDVEPRRISFTGALRLIRDLFLWAEVASPGKIPKMIRDMQSEMEALILPERRPERSYPRHVKIAVTKFRKNALHPA